MSVFDDMVKAVNEASRTLRAADTQVAAMARMCAGRLREAGVSSYTLVKLKRELRKFNMHTTTWQED